MKINTFPKLIVIFIVSYFIILFFVSYIIYKNNKTKVKVEEVKAVEVVVDKRLQGQSCAPHFFVMIKSKDKYYYKDNIEFYYKYNIGDTIMGK